MRPGILAQVVAAVVAAALFAAAGSTGSVRVGPVPLFALGTALAFLINWSAYLPALVARTERYYDLTGSITYIAVVAVCLAAAAAPDARAWLVAGLVTVWAVRLGTFLYRRVSRDGGDRRFDRIKHRADRFLLTWTLQALWVSVTLGPALAVITTTRPAPVGVETVVGLALWVGGFTVEVVADRQKARFRADPANRDRFISSGLWAWSRHPNYFGEIVLWTGMAVIALPVLGGWRWVMLVSPVFVAVLLTRLSGIPLLEARAEQRWGDDPGYRRYRDRTPRLIPRPPL